MAAADRLRPLAVVVALGMAAAGSVGCGQECSSREIQRAFDLAWEGDVVAMRALLDANPELGRARGCHGWDVLDRLTGRRTGLSERLFRRATGSQASTPLHVAARQGFGEMVGLLLERGADPDAGSEVGQSPLHLAAMYGHVEAARALLEHGASVDARASGGYTPLHLAAGHGRVEVVKLLLVHGADLRAREGGAWTPVHRAAAEGNAGILRILLSHGAEVDAVNDQGDTPLEYALIGDHDEAIR